MIDSELLSLLAVHLRACVYIRAQVAWRRFAGQERGRLLAMDHRYGGRLEGRLADIRDQRR